MRTGQCKFGSTCRFHHPVPSGVQPHSQQFSVDPASSQQYGVVVPRPQILPGSYVQSPYGYSQMVIPSGMVPYSGWNQPSIGSSSVYGITPLSPSAPAYQFGSSSTGQEQTFPQRPDQPECQYFMRTGDCKFGSSCRYHHPLEAASPKAVSHISLPHSSLTDMPVVSYPLGSSSLSTLASSDKLTETLSSSSTKPTTTTSGGPLAAGVSSSMASRVSHLEPDETNDDDSVRDVEAKTSS